MIPRYSDLAANERTYLAWLRTALALIAFGFVLEKFDLLLKTFTLSLHQEKFTHLPPFGRETGVILVTLGFLVMLLSTWRFTSTTRLIQSDKSEPYKIRGILILGGVFILLSLFILLYVTRVLTWI